MRLIHARNVNDALNKMVVLLRGGGYTRASRAGDVLVFPEPVTTIYHQPTERVLFSPERDANPYFHLMEALWMLGGRNDVAFVAHFNRRMTQFSDDGISQRGAYGCRWRSWFDLDQLDRVVALLRGNPDSRRAVIQMWDPSADLHVDEKLKDVPCNLTITVQLVGRSGTMFLDLAVFCRSNDVIWGAAGANAVHFSILQEYLASRLEVSVGKLYQVSINFHAYVDVLEGLVAKGYLDRLILDPYILRPTGEVDLVPDRLVDDVEEFEKELEHFLRWATTEPSQLCAGSTWNNSFFPKVAIPMAMAYAVFRWSEGEGRYEKMLGHLKEARRITPSSDWLFAAQGWVMRRQVEVQD